MSRQISLQKRIKSLVARNNDKMDVLLALMACFDDEGELKELYQDQLSIAIEKATKAIQFEQSIYKHATTKAMERITKDIEDKITK